MTQYNPDNQYRCSIIRSKSMSNMEDMLPAYAGIVDELCPCKKDEFVANFNDKLSRLITSPTKKTLDNHRTEIAGKLFGLWYESDNIIYQGAKLNLILEERDNPKFFKNILYYFQFPNGMDTLKNIKERIENNIKFHPAPYILKLLLLADSKKIMLSMNEVAYYVLNSLDVLQGFVTPKEVLDVIIKHRESKIFNKVQVTGKASSYTMQHIREFINLMVLANLITIERNASISCLVLNKKEMDSINIISKKYNKRLGFDIYSYDLNSKADVKKMSLEWSEFYCNSYLTIPEFNSSIFKIQSTSLEQNENKKLPIQPTANEIGNEGELLIFNLEKERVKKFNSRLSNKVILMANQKGLGYDIQSIDAELGNYAERARFLEVKSTFRVTPPTKVSKDSVYLTRNEWVAAEQHRNQYFIYRVYLSREGYRLFIVRNPVTQHEKGTLYAQPTKYLVEFDDKAGEFYE